MPKIKIDNQEIELEARPYSLTLYSREFGDEKDLVEDAQSLIEGYKVGKIKANIYMRLVWCFAKTKQLMNNVSIFPSFDDWMMGIGFLDVGNQEDMFEMVELINGSLFREEEKEKEESEQESE